MLINLIGEQPQATAPSGRPCLKGISHVACHMLAQFSLAKDAYEEGFRAWRAVCDASPALRSDPVLVSEMKEHLERYREVLAALQEPIESPVGLQDVIGAPEPVTL